MTLHKTEEREDKPAADVERGFLLCRNGGIVTIDPATHVSRPVSEIKTNPARPLLSLSPRSDFLCCGGSEVFRQLPGNAKKPDSERAPKVDSMQPLVAFPLIP